jgi:hypothetical protein
LDEEGNLFKNKGLRLAGIYARRRFFLRAKVAAAEMIAFRVANGDADGAGEEAGAASHASFLAMLNSGSILSKAQTA